MERERSRFESLFLSIYRNKYQLTRTYLGYQDNFVNACFLFWQEGRA